jgi:hypothetical protein
LIVARIKRSLTVKITLARVETVVENKVVVKNKPLIVEQIDHRRSRRHGKIARRLTAATVKQLMPGI